MIAAFNRAEEPFRGRALEIIAYALTVWTVLGVASFRLAVRGLNRGLHDRP